ncbi:MAG: 1-deoxy-D-xylulose-5-phosphate synthase [Verrucomicrobia bacterium]|nr:1-deoxy-D-xylulose-5-phosphate synthase [Verrucomicrobiota bacterium]MBS0646086.1 1-deoxy-D-xylulose-5-phosphate synthase [Verrucomicrobiota bacterium]
MNLKELKACSPHELVDVAQTMRKRIIDVMAKNGGHLASNLGSVELTLALHYVFSSPQDRLIFDVSHQCYTHKLLTDRDHARFDRIRKSDGLSGFTQPEESEHDLFFAGHAGTALSLALGMAHSRDLNQGQEHIIPIIGDASLTCGLTLEALNNIPQNLRSFLIILNDNAMSISHNVGGITTILSRLLTKPLAHRFSHALERVLATIPLYGQTFVRQKKSVEEALKGLFGSAAFFEHFGLSYVGPVDGHDVKKLVSLFKALKDQPMPVIVHLQTRKGQGLRLAEEDPVTFHGVKPFNPQTCEFLPVIEKGPAFPKVFGQHLLSMGEKYPKVVVVTPAMSLGSSLDAFFEKYPTRSFDVGIAEGHAVTFCGGLAKTGQSLVVCSIYATFLQRALDNVFHDICLQKLPVIFAIDRAGLATGDGVTHHGIYDMGFLQALPGMVICQPRNGELLIDLLESAPHWKQPVAIRYPNQITTVSTQSPHIRSLGRAEVLTHGDDLLILALGTMVDIAMCVQQSLKEQGIDATVVDPIFIKPLDTELLSNLLLNHQRIVILEEHAMSGGLGSAFCTFVAHHGFDHLQILHLALPDCFFEHGSLNDLYKKTGLTSPQVLSRIHAFFSWPAHKESQHV